MLRSPRRAHERRITSSQLVAVSGVLLFTAMVVPETAHAQGRTATLVAVVTDTSGKPLPGAAVWVGTGMSALTDQAGQVTIRRIPPGEYLVRARHDTHLTASVMLEFGRGTNAEVDFELEPADAIQLPGISVAVERRTPHLVREGFYQRKVQGLGSFVDRDRIQQLGLAGDLCRVFEELRGFSAWSPSGRCEVRSRRGISLPRTGLHAGAGALSTSPGSQFGSASNLCTPTFFVDGSIWDSDMVASLSPIHVEAVEGYAGPASTPHRFTRGMANFCGTIVIWLRW